MKQLLRRTLQAGANRLFGPGDRDPYHLAFGDFFARVNALERPRVLELGARARSGNTYRQRLRPDARYLGLDILAGPNVDLVGDAHQLDALLRPGSFDAVFSVSVFEHLAMPWRVAEAVGRVLRPGGLVFTATHPTYPPHEEPWDFFRFQPGAFRSLFGPTAGFELLGVHTGLPCRIVPLASDPPLLNLWRTPAFLGIACLARKVGPGTEKASARGVAGVPYPQGRG